MASMMLQFRTARMQVETLNRTLDERTLDLAQRVNVLETEILCNRANRLATTPSSPSLPSRLGPISSVSGPVATSTQDDVVITDNVQANKNVPWEPGSLALPATSACNRSFVSATQQSSFSSTGMEDSYPALSNVAPFAGPSVTTQGDVSLSASHVAGSSSAVSTTDNSTRENFNNVINNYHIFVPFPVFGYPSPPTFGVVSDIASAITLMVDMGMAPAGSMVCLTVEVLLILVDMMLMEGTAVMADTGLTPGARTGAV
ncbi:hypothetical protein BDP27DRAFT_1348486, partial [Rhodocollybia butyracea]